MSKYPIKDENEDLSAWCYEKRDDVVSKNKRLHDTVAWIDYNDKE